MINATNLTQQMAKAKKPHASKSEKKSKKYLGEFYEDRRYLENLLKDEGIFVVNVSFFFVHFFLKLIETFMLFYIIIVINQNCNN